jgi:hypothetical protein
MIEQFQFAIFIIESTGLAPSGFLLNRESGRKIERESAEEEATGQRGI